MKPTPQAPTVIGPRGPARTVDGPLFLICPRCALSIRVRTPWLLVEHCPRCVASAHIPVRLFRSPLPAEELYANGSAPTTERPPSAAPLRHRAELIDPIGAFDRNRDESGLNSIEHASARRSSCITAAGR